MPRLQILQHKSYHPYLEKNKEKVRKDEEKAAVLEAEQEREMLQADQAARLGFLRQRPDSINTNAQASSSSLMPSEPSKLLIRHRKNKDESAEDRIRKDARSERARLEFDWPDVEKRKAEKRAIKESEKRARDQELGRTNPDEHAEIGGTGKHINFWAGLEKDTASIPGAVMLNKPKPTPDQIQDDDPTTMYLNRPERETKPWYADAELKRHEEKSEDKDSQRKRESRKRKEEASKIRNDPLMLVQSALSTSQKKANPIYERHQSTIPAESTDPSAARIARESSERSRALALINEAKRKQAAASLSATPSTVAGGGNEYSDMWNAQEVREARRRREAVRGWAGEVGRDTREQAWDGDHRESRRDWANDAQSNRNSLPNRGRGRGQPRYWEV